MAFRLARHGLKVTAVDLSARAIESIEKRKRDLPITAIKADMREMKFNKGFDAAICMGNSFGYFDEQQTKEFLESLAAALKPDGGFILDTALAAETYFLVGGAREWVEVDGTVMLMDSDYDCQSAVLTSKFKFIRAGAVVEQHETQHHIFTCEQICRMLGESGFAVAGLYGSTDGEPFELGSERLLVHAVKIGD